MIQPQQRILPLKQLLHKAGIPGYLLFIDGLLGVILARGHHGGDFTDVSSQAIVRLIYLGVVLLFLIQRVVIKKESGTLHLINSQPLKYYLYYSIFAMLSTFWSVVPSLTAVRAFEGIVMMGLLCAVVSELNRKCSRQDMLEWVIMWAVWLLVCAFFRNIKLGGGGSIWRLGRLSIPVFFFLAMSLTQRSLFKWLIILSPVYALSNKVYIGVGLGALALIRGTSKYKFLFLFILIIFVSSVVVWDIETVIHQTFFRGREEVSVDNMSGRWQTWTACVNAFWEKPFLGGGFIAAEAYLEDRLYVSVHNMYMSAIVGLGTVGGVLIVLFTLSWLMIAASGKIPPSWRFAVLASAILSLVMAASGPGLGARVYGSWMPAMMVCVLTTQVYLNGLNTKANRNTAGLIERK